MANFEVFFASNHLNCSKFSSLAPSALAMYWHVYWFWARQKRFLCESVRFARYLVLRASAGDPDIATSNLFIGDSLTSKIEAQEYSFVGLRYSFLRSRWQTRPTLTLTLVFIFVHTSWAQTQNGGFFRAVCSGPEFAFFQSLHVFEWFSQYSFNSIDLVKQALCSNVMT